MEKTKRLDKRARSRKEKATPLETSFYHVHVLKQGRWCWTSNGDNQPRTFNERGKALESAKEIKAAYPGLLVRVAKFKCKRLEMV